MAASAADEATRRAALDALPKVCRTGTHLFAFARYVEGFRGWGRSLRRGVGALVRGPAAGAARLPGGQVPPARGHEPPRPPAPRPPGRETSAGNPRLPVSDEHAPCSSGSSAAATRPACRRSSQGFAAAQAAETPSETAALVREYRLPREAVKPEHLDDREVWAALLEQMPMTALLRNLATLTRVGVIAPGCDGTATAIAQLADAERLRRARVHPIAVLSALRTYATGRGVRGRHTWAPVAQVVDALDAAFYAAFGNVEPAGKRMLLALDVSGSMTCGAVAGVPGLTPRDASAVPVLRRAACPRSASTCWSGPRATSSAAATPTPSARSPSARPAGSAFPRGLARDAAERGRACSPALRPLTTTSSPAAPPRTATRGRSRRAACR